MGGGKGGSDTVTTRVEIPSYLQPLAEQSAGVSSDALSQLQNLLQGSTNTSLPAGAYIQDGRVVRTQPGTNGSYGSGAGGKNGFNQGTQSQIVDLGPVSDYQTFTGQPVLNAPFDPLEEEAFKQAEAIGRGAGGFVPLSQLNFLQTAAGVDPTSYLPQEASSALLDTAGGEYLYGGDGFNNALDAANRRAQRDVYSAFGNSVGAGNSGLAQTAIAQASADAFANLYGSERQRQLGSAGVLSDLSNTERQRQLAAAQALPGIGLAGSNILQNVGQARRGQAQQDIQAPITAIQQLLAASNGSAPFSSQLGQSQSTPINSNPIGSALGGAATLGGLAGSFFPGTAGASGLGGFTSLGPGGFGAALGAGALLGLLG